ncbi:MULTISPECIES: ESPR-type extended signal peptide-containing protein [unclassified Thioalkalivibrio]|uniref:ESPR-type extended signal peptide-containing protein n=1 Tax=unclassified Thioalkalivibrio TaxID=2621013 RepID=UPI0003A70AD8|nr:MULTISPECIES: ESPR-type extended signal peptide-containing protein [unclassified Thioalkalivibrio]
MNHIFKSIYNAGLGAWVAVSELDGRRGRQASGVSGQSPEITEAQRDSSGSMIRRMAALSAGVALGLCAASASAGLPSGGVFIHGSDGTITEIDSNTLEILADQLGDTALGNADGVTIDWTGGFNIGSGNEVIFSDQGAAGTPGIWVNIDQTGVLSQIDGAITNLTGAAVALINPNGMHIGGSAVLPSNFIGLAAEHDIDGDILSADLTDAPITVDAGVTIEGLDGLDSVTDHVEVAVNATDAQVDLVDAETDAPTLPFMTGQTGQSDAAWDAPEVVVDLENRDSLVGNSNVYLKLPDVEGGFDGDLNEQQLTIRSDSANVLRTHVLTPQDANLNLRYETDGSDGFKVVAPYETGGRLRGSVFVDAPNFNRTAGRSLQIAGFYDIVDADIETTDGRMYILSHLTGPQGNLWRDTIGYGDSFPGIRIQDARIVAEGNDSRVSIFQNLESENVDPGYEVALENVEISTNADGRNLIMNSAGGVHIDRLTYRSDHTGGGNLAIFSEDWRSNSRGHSLLIENSDIQTPDLQAHSYTDLGAEHGLTVRNTDIDADIVGFQSYSNMVGTPGDDPTDARGILVEDVNMSTMSLYAFVMDHGDLIVRDSNFDFIGDSSGWTTHADLMFDGWGNDGLVKLERVNIMDSSVEIFGDTAYSGAGSRSSAIELRDVVIGVTDESVMDEGWEGHSLIVENSGYDNRILLENVHYYGADYVMLYGGEVEVRDSEILGGFIDIFTEDHAQYADGSMRITDSDLTSLEDWWLGAFGGDMIIEGSRFEAGTDLNWAPMMEVGPGVVGSGNVMRIIDSEIISTVGLDLIADADGSSSNYSIGIMDSQIDAGDYLDVLAYSGSVAILRSNLEADESMLISADGGTSGDVVIQGSRLALSGMDGSMTIEASRDHGGDIVYRDASSIETNGGTLEFDGGGRTYLGVNPDSDLEGDLTNDQTWTADANHTETTINGVAVADMGDDDMVRFNTDYNPEGVDGTLFDPSEGGTVILAAGENDEPGEEGRTLRTIWASGEVAPEPEPEPNPEPEPEPEPETDIDDPAVTEGFVINAEITRDRGFEEPVSHSDRTLWTHSHDASSDASITTSTSDAEPEGNIDLQDEEREDETISN